MGAIFGIVGEGSLDEVRAMREPVIHRGEYQQSARVSSDLYSLANAKRPRRIV